MLWRSGRAPSQVPDADQRLVVELTSMGKGWVGSWYVAAPTRRTEQTVVVVPSLSMDPRELRKITGVWHYDLGPDAVRTIGVMNIGEGGVTVNGAGNAYPVLGTGTTSYTQAGVLLPGDLGGARLQPYATAQVSWLDALGEPMVAPEAGVNLLLQGHHNKVTLHWRNRPIYVAPLGGGAPTVGLRANEAIVQYAVFY